MSNPAGTPPPKGSIFSFRLDSGDQIALIQVESGHVMLRVEQPNGIEASAILRHAEAHVLSASALLMVGHVPTAAQLADLAVSLTRSDANNRAAQLEFTAALRALLQALPKGGR